MLFVSTDSSRWSPGAGTGIGAALARALAEAGADVACHGNSTSPDDDRRADPQLGRRAAVARRAISRDGATADALVEGDRPRARRASTSWSTTPASSGARPRSSLPTTTGTAVAGREPDRRVPPVPRRRQAHARARARQDRQHRLAARRSRAASPCPAYAASKGGVAQLTKALANEWAGKGVNVNAIAPGYIRTDNTAALRGRPTRNRQILERIPAGRWGEPADLGGAAVFLASRASDYVSGHVLVVDGGWMGR